MLSNYSVTVTTSPTLLVVGHGTNADPTRVYIAHTSASAVFVGDQVVSTTTGLPVASSNVFTMQLRAGESLYGVVASGSVDVRVVRTV